MKITRLRTMLVQIPFDPPIGVGFAQFRTGGCVLVFLESDQGAVGEGLVFSLNGNRLAVLDAMVKSLEPLVVGIDPHMSGAFSLRAAADLRNVGTSGIATLALAGIECALLDLRAKLADLSVARLLGACRTALPVYHSSELWVSKSIDELQNAAAAHLEKGFRAMKMRLKCDPADLGADVVRVRAVRDVIGPDVALMADANQKLSEPQALRLGRMLEEFELAWLEEPVVAHNHAAEARIAAALDTPIASGESVFGSRGVVEMLRLRSVDVLMPDLLRMGGPGEFMKAASLAAAHDTPVSNHTYPEMSIGLMAAVPNANILEYMDWVSPIYREAIELDGEGRAVVPDRPGWGFSFDPAAIKKFAAA
jgi:L-alanine-DL-glutamate epimerase-like enolase superfamily enzyme